MKTPQFRPATTAKLAAILALAISCAPLAAQVPENAVVIGTAALGKHTGTTGVFYVTLPTSSSSGGVRIRLLRLPPELTVKSGNGAFGGAWSVLRRPSDGTLFVGDGATSGKWCHVHILKMAGPVVLSYRSVRVGQVLSVPGNTRIVGGLALLPDGRVVVSGGWFSAGPMAGSPVAILDDRPTTPTVTPVRLSSPLAGTFAWGVAVSPDGRTAYVIDQTSAPTFFPGRLYKIDITKPNQPVAPVLLHTWNRCLVPKVTADRNGVLHATCAEPGNSATVPAIQEIRVLANNTVTIKSTQVSPRTAVVAPALERGTGRFVFASGYIPTLANNHSVMMGDRNGKVSLLAGPPAGGWGLPFSIDINNTFETYGTGTKAANSYAFVDFPNPGGPPEVGNSKFSMTVEWAGAQTIPSLIIMSTQDIDVVVLGLRLLVRPDFLLPMTLQPGQATLPLPIPNEAGLRGLTLFTQGLHLEPAFATSNGLRIDIR